ncbi:MAG: tyrosine-type recombinase/integrase [Pseudanabaenaceae cyanobacterium]
MSLVEQFLAQRSSGITRLAYRRDLQKLADFLQQPLEVWLQLPQQRAEALLHEFFANLGEDRPSTNKRRLGVIASLVSFANAQQACQWRLKPSQWKFTGDTSRASLPAEAIAQLLAVINCSTLVGKRDYALLCLLSEGKWRGSSLLALNCTDVPDLAVSNRTRTALEDWLAHHPAPPPLFISLDRRHWGQRLTSQAMSIRLQHWAKLAGIPNLHLWDLRPTPPPPAPITGIASTQPHSSDLLTALLADRRSANTRRAYQQDLKYFFRAMYQQDPDPQLVEAFLRLGRFPAIALVLQYKAQMVKAGLKEATVNRRLAALKALVSLANKLGHCQWHLQEIQSERVQPYRDTTGIPPAGIKAMLSAVDQTQRAGKRDYAILRLLWDNALRRQEISQTNISDFDPSQRTLKILGKGAGAQHTTISLSPATQQAILNWLAELEQLHLARPEQPLFIALDPPHLGHRLTGTAIYQLVQTYAQQAGINKTMSPHRIRHSAITAALDATNGNVRKVQKFSRHKKLDTLMIYDDNRNNLQGEVSNLLSELL